MSPQTAPDPARMIPIH